MKKIVLGILAHVDAGKTTLSEGLLYRTGKIKSPGRVDRGSAALDDHELERQRGITIFSNQAALDHGGSHFVLLDTPGHVDFSAEMERSLQVMDYAVLVISATDGVQAHTETLWRLLRQYDVPAFIFVTKMDLARRRREELMEELRLRLGEQCLDFTVRPDDEDLAMCGEELLEKYMDSGEVTEGDIAALVAQRRLCPCYFGSGLKMEGLEALLKGLDSYTLQPPYGEDFSARVYKISRDAQGRRLTHMKLTGGSLRVRTPLKYTAEGENFEEKVNLLRVPDGARLEAAESAAGGVCIVTGLSRTYPGQALGDEAEDARPILSPVLSYRIRLPEGMDPMLALPKLRELEEEDPLLRIEWNARSREVQAQLMGEVQIQVLKSLIKSRFDMDVELHSGRIMYRETIAAPVEGVGHFEPLRHYAEVHLLLEPLERGEGLRFAANCPEDSLDRNWQRLILTHLMEKQHLGVLTGSPITDMKISLIAGRAHLKHTEGGDFRQATYRAVRQGLMSADSILLEPWYDFRIEVPAELIGRAISDIRAMSGEFSSPETEGDTARMEGRAPVAAMEGYVTTLAAYSSGRGRLFTSPGGYMPCHNAKEVIESIGYEAEADTENTSDSVFCAHGAGFNVKWNEVRSYMHIDTGFGRVKEPAEDAPRPRVISGNLNIDDKQLESIMLREFGPIKRPVYNAPKHAAVSAGITTAAAGKKEFLIVDGYNVIHAWDELKELASDSLDIARKKLMDCLVSYRGFTGSELVLVFDAYRVPGNPGSKFDYHSIHVVYTADGETADAYIEKLSHDIGKNWSVRVVSSDNLIRVSAMRSGVLRTSADAFEHEVDWAMAQIRELLKKSGHKSHLSGVNFEGGGNGI